MKPPKGAIFDEFPDWPFVVAGLAMILWPMLKRMAVLIWVAWRWNRGNHPFWWF